MAWVALEEPKSLEDEASVMGGDETDDADVAERHGDKRSAVVARLNEL